MSRCIAATRVAIQPETFAVRRQNYGESSRQPLQKEARSFRPGSPASSASPGKRRPQARARAIRWARGAMVQPRGHRGGQPGRRHLGGGHRRGREWCPANPGHPAPGLLVLASQWGSRSGEPGSGWLHSIRRAGRLRRSGSDKTLRERAVLEGGPWSHRRRRRWCRSAASDPWRRGSAVARWTPPLAPARPTTQTAARCWSACRSAP